MWTCSSTTPGCPSLYGQATDVTEAMWDKVVDLNMKGVFRLTTLVASRMVGHGGGSIVNVSSVGSIRPNASILPYAAAKAGMNSLTDGFARTYGPTVRVNCIMAGPFFTDVSKAWDMEAIAVGLQRHALAAGRRTRRGGGRRALLRQRRVELHHGSRPARRRRDPLGAMAVARHPRGGAGQEPDPKKGFPGRSRPARRSATSGRRWRPASSASRVARRLFS